MRVTATEAKNRFGHCLSQAKISPVRIEKNGRLEALIVSAEQFADLERRANAAKNYLVGLGISADRLNTVSFGKERPVELGSNEQAWARNRRAVTVTID